MVISFDTDVDLLADFTDDRAQVEQAIQKARMARCNTGVTPGTIPTRSTPPVRFFMTRVFLACNDKAGDGTGERRW